MEEKQTNIYDVINNLIDKLSLLTVTGNLAGVIILGFIFIASLVVWRIPSQEISPFFLRLVEILQKRYFASSLLVITNIFTVKVCLVQRRRYKKEVDRLAETKRQIIHGKKQEGWNTIPKHTSSEIELDKED